MAGFLNNSGEVFCFEKGLLLDVNSNEVFHAMNYGIFLILSILEVIIEVVKERVVIIALRAA